MEQNTFTLTALMENRPGVLNRVVSLFRRRSFNLDSLTVGRTERDEISRMTLVLEGTASDANRAEAELAKLVQVIRVEQLNDTPHVARDLALIKVAVNSDNRQELRDLCEIFRARVIDVASDSMVIELTGDEGKLEGFTAQLRRFGIIEMVRTGLVALGRAEHVLDRHGYRSSWAESGQKPARVS